MGRAATDGTKLRQKTRNARVAGRGDISVHNAGTWGRSAALAASQVTWWQSAGMRRGQLPRCIQVSRGRRPVVLPRLPCAMPRQEPRNMPSTDMQGQYAAAKAGGPTGCRTARQARLQTPHRERCLRRAGDRCFDGGDHGHNSRGYRSYRGAYQNDEAVRATSWASRRPTLHSSSYSLSPAPAHSSTSTHGDWESSILREAPVTKRLRTLYRGPGNVYIERP